MENRILLALCAAMFFLGSWWVPVTDPTENCYALTAKEMLAAGDYFSPRIYGDYWYDKPILFYWELLLSYKIFGVNEFAARFFPAVFATLGVFLTKFFAGKMFNPKVGFAAAVILATMPEYWYIAHAIITDMTLFCALSSTLMFFYFGWAERKNSYIYAAFATSGVAVLTKGPIGFFLPGLIILLFLLSQRDLKFLLKMPLARGLGILLAIASIWYVPMYFMHGAKFLEEFLGVHNFLRATVSEHPQFNVWYYYILVFLIGTAPWSLPVLYSTLKHLRFPQLDSRRRFLIIWAVTVFVVFQSFATKYPTYTFPYMMPLAILFAGFFVERQILFRRMAAAMAVVLVIFTFAAIPICSRNSGKAAAEIILPLVDAQTCVVSYSNAYPGSLVFYSGLKVYRLEETARIAKLKPHEMSWTAVNVMPFMDFKDLPKDKKIIAVVTDKAAWKFFDLTQGSWQRVAELPDWKIYRRD